MIVSVFAFCLRFIFFFFNDTATTEIYTLSLHDALPIWAWGGCAGRALRRLRLRCPRRRRCRSPRSRPRGAERAPRYRAGDEDRKSTRLNSSHANISYAVFCLKKKKKNSIDGII